MKVVVGIVLFVVNGKYKMFVIVGLMVEKKINKYLVVEIGLLYLNLCVE